MGKTLILLFGVICYLSFLIAIVYAMGFVSNLLVPKGIDDGMPTTPPIAILINSLLLGLFAIQHTIMARPAFKTWWTKIVPEPIERSIFVLAASLLLLLTYWQWRPMPTLIWELTNPTIANTLYVISFLGWAIVLYSSFLINHFDLFGLRQVFLHFQDKEYAHNKFRTPGLYRFVRNPLMLGLIIAFWSTPAMSQGHLLFAGLTTAYIIIGIHFEERDIVSFLGGEYTQYQQATPMLVPRPWKKWTE
jgi:protein-S-isoprenylcysteine O-methyltransferase Ste14